LGGWERGVLLSALRLHLRSLTRNAAPLWCVPHPQDVRAKFGDDWERIARMSIIEEAPGGEK